MATHRVLISARDTGAALALAPVLNFLKQRLDVQVSILAANPAHDRLIQIADTAQGSDIRLIEGTLPFPSQVEACIQELGRFRPTAILGGLSGPDAGIDEALIAAAGPERCTTVQDWPGWVVEGPSGPAHHYLVGSDYAARLTQEQGIERVTVVGALARSDAFDAQLAGLPERGDHCLFLGQPLHMLKGYGQSLIDLASVMRQLGKSWSYRPHPAEDPADVAALLTAISGSGGSCTTMVGKSLFQDISAADLIVSCFSSALDDALILGARQSAGPATIVYLLHDRGVLDFYRQHSASMLPPAVETGIAAAVLSDDQIMGTLSKPRTSSATQALPIYPPPDPDGAVRALLGE